MSVNLMSYYTHNKILEDPVTQMILCGICWQFSFSENTPMFHFCVHAIVPLRSSDEDGSVLIDGLKLCLVQMNALRISFVLLHLFNLCT